MQVKTKTEDGHPSFTDTIELRDYFAAKALEGVLSGDGLLWFNVHPDYYNTPKKLAGFAYRMADSMLKARKENK